MSNICTILVKYFAQYYLIFAHIFQYFTYLLILYNIYQYCTQCFTGLVCRWSRIEAGESSRARAITVPAPPLPALPETHRRPLQRHTGRGCGLPETPGRYRDCIACDGSYVVFAAPSKAPSPLLDSASRGGEGNCVVMWRSCRCRSMHAGGNLKKTHCH